MGELVAVAVAIGRYRGAISRISSGMAGNGCRFVSGDRTEGVSAWRSRVGMGDRQNWDWREFVVGDRAANSARMASAAGLGRLGGDGIAGALRELSSHRTVVAQGWGGRGPNHGQAAVVRIVERVLGRRWNLGFRQLGHEWTFQPLHRKLGVARAGFLVFVLSGLIHDLVISVPARGGYGLPTGYFVLQGAGVALERSQIGWRLGLRSGVNGWVFMALLTAGPVFWLFHPPFLRNVVLPFMRVIGTI